MTPLPVGNSMNPYCGCGGEGHDGPCYGPKYSRIKATYSGDPITPIEPPDRWQTDIAVVIVAIIVLLVIAGLASLSVAR